MNKIFKNAWILLILIMLPLCGCKTGMINVQSPDKVLEITPMPVATSSLLVGTLPVLKKWPPIILPDVPATERLPGQKIAYLTFDDGPAPIGMKPASGTQNLLDILERRNIRATFFLVGKNIYDNPDLARRIAANGHVIGNQTWSHVNFNFVKGKMFEQEVEVTNEVIFDVTGINTTLIRPPGGHRPDKAQLAFLREKNMKLFWWNVDTKDWTGNSDARILSAIQKGIDTHVDLVILFHDYAFGALDEAIDLLLANGYVFDTLDHITEFRLPLSEK
jgi:peptidoglycan-N-acetylglucosamine deacetylase